MTGGTGRPRPFLSGLATFAIGLLVLFAGMLPPGVIATGQLTPFAWMAPALIGLAALLMLFQRLFAGLSPVLWSVAVAVVVLPPLVLCIAGAERLSSAFIYPPERLGTAERRPRLTVMSGPRLFAPEPSEGENHVIRGFVAAPLWQALARRFDPRPADALGDAALRNAGLLLLVQPRALAPEEMVALDAWIRGGGRAVLLLDPELRWADGRALGDPLRPPLRSLLIALLRHWGLTLKDPPSRAAGADPVERRFLADGRLLQLAGASGFRSDRPTCGLSEGGLVARCRIGKGMAVAVADADFANDALWTTAPERPEHSRYWTSDAVPVIAGWLDPASEASQPKPIWLHRIDGLPGALRIAIIVLLCLSVVPVLQILRGRTNAELKVSSHP
ncbi:MAG TPA: hypothetical protein VL918_11005 [Sphingobium sp.]|nr:hypothetical protein [Sphingobium sp.]